MSYYVVQQYRGSFDSEVDVCWRNNSIQYNRAVDALAAFRGHLMHFPLYSAMRVVEAFYCPSNRVQIVRAVLDYKDAAK